MLRQSKWYQGLPPVDAVLEHEKRFACPTPGSVKVTWMEGDDDNTQYKERYVPVDDLKQEGLWLCVVADGFFEEKSLPNPRRLSRTTRLVSLRVIEGEVVYLIGWVNDAMPVAKTTWGPGSRFLPLQDDGTPIGWSSPGPRQL